MLQLYAANYNTEEITPRLLVAVVGSAVEEAVFMSESINALSKVDQSCAGNFQALIQKVSIKILQNEGS